MHKCTVLVNDKLLPTFVEIIKYPYSLLVFTPDSEKKFHFETETSSVWVTYLTSQNFQICSCKSCLMHTVDHFDSKNIVQL